MKRRRRAIERKNRALEKEVAQSKEIWEQENRVTMATKLEATLQRNAQLEAELEALKVAYSASQSAKDACDSISEAVRQSPLATHTSAPESQQEEVRQSATLISIDAEISEAFVG